MIVINPGGIEAMDDDAVAVDGQDLNGVSRFYEISFSHNIDNLLVELGPSGRAQRRQSHTGARNQVVKAGWGRGVAGGSIRFFSENEPVPGAVAHQQPDERRGAGESSQPNKDGRWRSEPGKGEIGAQADGGEAADAKDVEPGNHEDLQQNHHIAEYQQSDGIDP